MTSSLKNTVIGSLFWKFLEQCATGGAQLIIGIILARLLLPEDYAILILATVFISLSKIFIDSGLSTALIQKKELSDEDTSSVFYLSIAISLILYTILFLTAPLIADLYSSPLLTPVLRVLGLTLFIGVFTSMQQVFVSREFQFKKQFIVSFSSALISGIAGIIIAYQGYGVWALVVQQLTAAVLTAVILSVLIRWKPKIRFSIEKVKGLFSYGWKILVASLIEKGYDSIRDLSIGAVYTKNDLSYYSKGMEYPSYLGSALDGSISAVFFPAYSKYQDDKKTLKTMMRRSLTASTFIVFPAMFGLAAIAEPFVLLFLTEKWEMCIPFIQIFCLSFALQPISSANLAMIKATGQMRTYLRIQIIKTIFSFICLLCTIPISVTAIAMGALISRIFAIYVNSFPNKKLIGYSQLEMLKDLLPCLLLSGVMFVAVYSIQFIGLALPITLCLQIVVGVIVYFGIAKLLKMKILEFVVSSMKEYIKGLRNPND